MSLEFIGRLQKELSLTTSAIYETVLAIAERVNRKVHILRLHGQAARTLSQIETVQAGLGREIAASFPLRSSDAGQRSFDIQDLEGRLAKSTDRVHQLKQTLLEIDAKIRELKLEAVHEDLLGLQRELSLRSGTIEQVLISKNCRAIGKSIGELSLPPSLRVVAVFRGPFLVPPSDGFAFRPDDVAVIIGLKTDLEQAAFWFTPSRAAQSA